jgi:membrane fusion protein (multidrug efflux system)
MQLSKNGYQLFRWALVLATLASLICLGGCKNSQQSAPVQIPEVGIVLVRPQQIVLTTELPGRTSAFRVAEIRPQVNGLIQKRLFMEGSDVRAGQDLYQIDPASFRAVFDNAKAALVRAEAALPALRLRADRFKQALADKAVSQQDFDDADAALKQADADVQYWKATVETARINLGYARVISPISGRIGRSNVTDGAIVTAYQPVALATIQQLDPIYIDVPQSSTELLRLRRRLEEGLINRKGTKLNKVKLFLADGIPYPLEGNLQFRDVSVDPTTGSVILRMVFPNPNGVLLPGMYVRVVVKEGVNENAVLIPQQAVSRDPKGNPTALIVDAADKVEQRMLKLDRAIGDQWFVIAGLTAGDRLIVEGMQKVRPGAVVKAVPFDGGLKNKPESEKTAQPAQKSK